MCIINLYAFIEERIFEKKKKYCKKKYQSFLIKFDLIDGNRSKSSFIGCNPYEGTYINLCKCLVASKQIKPSDSILDVGCGAGIFLSFLYLHSFQNLYGIEIDQKLFAIAKKNKETLYYKKIKDAGSIVLINDNIFDIEIDDSINVFYLYNTFSSEDKYLEFFNLVEKSLNRKERKIKIIFLYLTDPARKALKQTSWLTKKIIIRDKKQFCSDCLKFMIYEN